MKILRRLIWVFGALAVLVAAFFAWVNWPNRPAPSVPPPSVSAPRPPVEYEPPSYLPSNDPPSAPNVASAPIAGGPPEDCQPGGPSVSAAPVNAASLGTMAWAPFGRGETGWEIYAPRVANEIATACAPGTPRFADALARWQGGHGLKATGTFDPDTFKVMLVRWHRARPFVRVNGEGVCPNAPAVSSLATARPQESFGGKIIQLRPGALEAYRRMYAEAKAAGVLTRPEALTIYSGFRDPAADAARCARDNNCQGMVRTICSAHRTGLAMDVYIAAALGFGPDSSNDANRLIMTRSDLYRWLVANAGRFGFVNYVYEPWHWEWTGEPMLPGVPINSLPQAGSGSATDPLLNPPAAPAPVVAPAPAPPPKARPPSKPPPRRPAGS
ncbi:D-alanyl-D-alanine carboxypeptidase family protein [Caulobacter sp. DWR2-3-1b2]|uniref:D-alanyl-D-alanine carboxypeptidase family protein n=1 Tax=unclassified Caulobacter TaxID=2648921 RepID=UPI0019A80291|nr:D-alanyl-D-alanine carboxypeptidase family protein [Caulobacter sp.]